MLGYKPTKYQNYTLTIEFVRLSKSEFLLSYNPAVMNQYFTNFVKKNL